MKVLFSISAVILVTYTLLTGAPWAWVGLLLLVILSISNAVTLLVVSLYWAIFAEHSREEDGPLRNRIASWAQRREGETERMAIERTLKVLVEIGVPTIRVLDRYGLPMVLLSLALSAAVLYGALTTGHLIFAALLLLSEIIFYNCLHWLRKHKAIIATDVRDACDLLLSNAPKDASDD